jgi:hypothetical protein
MFSGFFRQVFENFTTIGSAEPHAKIARVRVCKPKRPGTRRVRLGGGEGERVSSWSAGVLQNINPKRVAVMLSIAPSC